MSGGVDSSVAALLLKQQGYNIEGVFMHNWQSDQDDRYCSATQDLKDAKAIAEKLQIPLTIISFAREYWDRVFQNFLDEYAAGRTPNPDILCNKEIKFKAFLDYALEQGADYIATGHYVRKDQKNDKYRLLKAKDKNKDQSYFLYTLNQQQLKHSLFPLGDLQKSVVRRIAEQNGFINYNKKDSTGICFIGERHFKTFLSEYLLNQPGEIITTEHKIIGKHDGLMFYTLGQRKGLGIGGQKNAEEKPWYVAAKNLAKNQLIVTQEHDHPLLLSKSLTYKDSHFISGTAPTLPYPCTAKIRYHKPDEKCTIIKVDMVEFEEPQWAITSGQSIVFYKNEECLGGGIIC
jgi:tRNA-specific 2-thiouridylase